MMKIEISSIVSTGYGPSQAFNAYLFVYLLIEVVKNGFVKSSNQAARR